MRKEIEFETIIYDKRDTNGCPRAILIAIRWQLRLLLAVISILIFYPHLRPRQ